MIPLEVNTHPGDRWEEGIEHDARSKELLDWVKDYDSVFCNAELSDILKTGGDGDPGESLMYLLDEYFAAKDNYDR